MQHSFNVELAKSEGILEAILLENIHFWIEKNRANNKNFIDGCYWTYNSKKAFAELFPYATERQIKYALEKLIKRGILKTKNFNEQSFDRTLWYAITEYGYSIIQNCPMEQTKLSMASDKIVQPIPDNKPDILPPIIPLGDEPDKKATDSELIEQVVDYLNEKGGTSFKPTTKKTATLISARIKQGYSLDDFKDVIWYCYYEWVAEPKRFKNGQMSDSYFRPSTIFAEANFENYLQEYRKKVQRDG